MPRFAYVNGRYIDHRRAAVHVEDRGYQLADGVYEVIHLFRGRLVDEDAHLDRLGRSLEELRMSWPISRSALGVAIRELIRRNRYATGLVYIQVTRGVAPRDHKFPIVGRPVLVMTIRPISEFPTEMRENGVAVITIDDLRWARCDIKTVALLPNVLGKQAAAEAGAYEAWMCDGDGFVTEGTSSNAWIVTDEGTLVTRPAGPDILRGITRQAILALAEVQEVPVEERKFTREEALAAREAFLSNSSHFVTPVTSIDDVVIANGKPGSLSVALHKRYMDYMEAMPAALDDTQRKKSLS
ncbi:MAG: D-amino acid aminotransferase [Rhodospirillaceae bacterium]|nr:D-amino acid aminotransferase [Rhodospirillaceae bacterium]